MSIKGTDATESPPAAVNQAPAPGTSEVPSPVDSKKLKAKFPFTNDQIQIMRNMIANEVKEAVKTSIEGVVEKLSASKDVSARIDEALNEVKGLTEKVNSAPMYASMRKENLSTFVRAIQESCSVSPPAMSLNQGQAKMYEEKIQELEELLKVEGGCGMVPLGKLFFITGVTVCRIYRELNEHREGVANSGDNSIAIANHGALLEGLQGTVSELEERLAQMAVDRAAASDEEGEEEEHEEEEVEEKRGYITVPGFRQHMFRGQTRFRPEEESSHVVAHEEEQEIDFFANETEGPVVRDYRRPPTSGEHLKKSSFGAAAASVPARVAVEHYEPLRRVGTTKDMEESRAMIKGIVGGQKVSSAAPKTTIAKAKVAKGKSTREEVDSILNRLA